MVSEPATTPPPATAPARSTVVVEACDTYEADAVRQALRAALAPLGGLASFVVPGQTVLLKPNLLSPRPPERAVTTHPALVQAMAELCWEAGAGRVWIGDSCAGNHSDRELWLKTGMCAVAAATGAELQTFSGPARSHACAGVHLPVPEWYAAVDVLVSLPKLKTHLLTTMTCAVKNLYGMVCGQAKAFQHGRFPSPQAMSHFLAHVFAVFQPALTVVDAIQAMEGDGPANGQPLQVGCLLASTDAVAIDSLCTERLGLNWNALPMVRTAVHLGLGRADPDEIAVIGAGQERFRHVRLRRARGRFLQVLPHWSFRCVSWLLKYRPEIRQRRCVRCGVCAATCSRNAIDCDSLGRFKIDRGHCILCICCAESCPEEAIEVCSPWRTFQRLARLCRCRSKAP